MVEHEMKVHSLGITIDGLTFTWSQIVNVEHAEDDGKWCLFIVNVLNKRMRLQCKSKQHTLRMHEYVIKGHSAAVHARTIDEDIFEKS